MSGRFERLQFVATCVHVLRCATIFLVCVSTSSMWAFVSIICVSQGIKAVSDFWSALAITLVVDETNLRIRASDPDAPSCEGRYIGVINSFFGFGVAISSSAILIGLSQSALDVVDCVEFDDNSTAYEACYKIDQEFQPDRAIMYIRGVYFAVVPFFSSLLGSYHSCLSDSRRSTSKDRTREGSDRRIRI